MSRLTTAGIIKTAIISAFSIAAALIWKDVIMDIITLLAPPRDELFYKLLVAVVATVIIIIAIYLFIGAESEAEVIIKKLKNKNRKK